MFSIKKLLGHDEKFFDLLESSADQADQSVHHLVALLPNWSARNRPRASRNSSSAGARINKSPKN